MFRTRFFSVLALTATLAASALAESPDRHAWVPVREGDFRVVPSIQRDLAVRLDIIKHAQHNIDIVIWEQKFDESIGKPVLTALRDAADRGVHVRFATTWLAMKIRDPKNQSGLYLTHPSTRTPIEYRLFGGFDTKTPGLGFDASLHEKLMVVDGKIVLSTGRGHSDAYLKWLDTSLLIRGPLVQEAQDVVNSVFTDVAKEGDPLPNVAATVGQKVARFDVIPDMSPAREEDESTADIAWAEATLDPNAVMLDLEGAETGGRARILHHDYVHQIQDYYARTHKTLPKRPLERYPYFSDPIVSEMIRLLNAHPREARICSLSLLMHPELERAIKKAAKAGTQITILFNDLSAKVDPMNMPFMTALPHAINLVSASPNVHLLGLQQGAGWPYMYLHRKLAVVDDTVIMGSHNLNLPSTTDNDEASFEIQDAGLAAQLRTLFDVDAARAAIPVDRATLESELNSSILPSILGHQLLGTF
ncbi:MAG TPA: phosphatidylserine/phosphatidylglycerophosphate/cardiolipin synthase family protein [Bdellovibrionota bacterium]|nr:phosphatidylserine/phosphatidylglycerophosphate/cardiolipin synthase family protein [Bdellovibrionota bacterium]